MTSLPHDHVPFSQMRSYITGYLGSLILTLLAFVITAEYVQHQTKFVNTSSVALILSLLAVTQIGLQARYFLHLGTEERPYWNSIVFVYTAIMVLCVVVGSLWIMYNLNYYMMTPLEMDHYMLER